jgi:hypothetical protein
MDGLAWKGSKAKFEEPSSMITSALHLQSQTEHPGPLLGYINAGYCMASVVSPPCSDQWPWIGPQCEEDKVDDHEVSPARGASKAQFVQDPKKAVDAINLSD